MITAVIIDNEPKSVFTLGSFLAAHCPQVMLKGSASNARTAKELIVRETPQLIFLDIEMPLGSGFDLLASMPAIDFEIIFVTAYNQYAVSAFRFSAVDYLLKPVRITLLKEAVAKAERRITEKNTVKNYELLLRNLNEQSSLKQKIVLTDRGEQYPVPLEEIVYLAGSSNYTHVHTVSKVFLSTRRLKEFEEMLPADFFCRIHNSYIVNIRYVEKVEKGRGGALALKDGTKLEIAYRRKEEFAKLFIK